MPRVAPQKRNEKLSRDDCKNIADNVTDFLSNKERGMKQFYETINKGSVTINGKLLILFESAFPVQRVGTAAATGLVRFRVRQRPRRRRRAPSPMSEHRRLAR